MPLTVKAQLTADASGFKAGLREAEVAARELDRTLDRLSATAQENERALARSAAAARSAPTHVPQPPPARNAPAAPLPRPPGAAPAGGPATGGLADWQRRNLRSQYFDIASSLYGGMSPLTVLSQQGPQIVEAYGGVGQAVRGVASAFTAARLAIGGVAGAVVGATVAWRSYTQAQEEAARSLNGIGRASGLTVSGLREAARQAAAPGRLSQADALAGAQGFAAAGVRGDLVAGLTASASRFAKGFGVEMAQASEMFAEAMQDPAKGADALSARLGFLDGKTRELIRSLMAQGDQFGAQKLLADRLAASVSRLTTDTNALDRAWRGVKDTASDAWTGLGGAVDRLVSGPGLDQQMQAAERGLAEAKAQTNGNIWSSQAWHAAELRKAQAEFDRVKALVDAERKQAADAQREIAANALSARATDAMRALSPDATARQDLSDRVKRLRDTMASPDAAAKVGSVGSLADAVAKAQRALDTFIDTDARARASDALSIRSIEARTAAQRAEIAAERERLSLAGDAGVGAAEARRREQAARDQVFAQARVDATGRLRAARDAAALVGLSDHPRRLREIDQRAREAALAALGDPRAEAAAGAAAATERATATREAQLGPLRQAGASLAEQTAALERQRQAFGATTQAAAEFAAKQALINDYLRAGVPITEAMRGEIDRYAAAQGRVAQAGEELQRAQARVVSGLDDIRAEARGAFSGLISDLREGKSVTDGLLNSATRMLDRVIEARVTGPLVEGLLGKDGSAGGGLFGDAVAGWLGKGAVATANITAATVIVNGSATAAGLGLSAGAQPAAGAADAASAAGGMVAGKTFAVPRGAAGLDGDFQQRLGALFEQFPGLEITSGFRTRAQQAALYAAKPGWAAPPGRSNHERGLAADIGLGGGWSWEDVHAAAGRYGIRFPLKDRRVRPEPWHAEPIAGWRAPAADVPVPPRLPAEFDRLADATARATEASTALPTAFDTVSKSLSQGSGSLATAASGVTAGAQQFQAGADGIFSAVLSGVGQVGNRFVGGLGTALQTILQAVSQGGGGGVGGFFSAIFGGGGGGSAWAATNAFGPYYALGGVHAGGAPRALRRFAGGGVSTRAAIFGEAGPEAAVPLPDGRSIPVTLRLDGAPAPSENGATSLPLTALAGAFRRLEDRLAAAAAPAPVAPAAPQIVVENRAGAQITQTEEQGPNGRRRRLIVDGMVADAAGRPNSRTLAAMGAARQIGRR